MDNIILASDAYKMTHWLQYPKGTKYVYSYFESRGGEFGETCFFGLQYLLKKHLEGVVLTKKMIDEAEDFLLNVFGINYFNRRGWERILNVHGGRLPLEIKAVPEGNVIPAHNVLMTIQNTDPELPWLTNFVETLLVETWYPITVATVSYEIRKLIDDYAKQTGCETSPFHLNDFGYRGVSSKESAGIGGMSHLVNFMGTDTLAGIEFAMKYYNQPTVCGHSVLAAEHSTVTSYGRDNEEKAYRSILNAAPNTAIVSIVADSYDYENAVRNIFGKNMKEEILSRKGKLVVRPDSGDPIVQAVNGLKWLWESFAGTVNDKGYKVLNPRVGVIYGDGINFYSIREILNAVKIAGFSVENIIFGMGGALLQQGNRDTHKFAFKCSAINIDDKWQPVYKKPVTDSGKDSKPGRLKLVRSNWGVWNTISEFYGKNNWENAEDKMRTVFYNGYLENETTFEEVRERAKRYPTLVQP